MRRFLLAFLIVLISTSCLLGAPLAERVPADAILYVGWQGAQAAGPAYANSLLKQVVDAGDLAQMPDYVDRLLTRAGKETAFAQMSQVLRPVLNTLWNSPAALYVGPVAKPALGADRVRVVLIIDAGPAAADTAAKLQQALAKQPPEISVKTAGSLVAIGSGLDDAFMNLLSGRLAGQGTLAQSPDFVASANKVADNAALTFYCSIDALRAEFDRSAGPDWAKLRDALQVQGLHSFICTSAFDGRQWGTQIFLAAPAPRKGIATLFDPPPLSDDLLSAVPRNATLMMACQFDLARTIKEARTILGNISPEAQAKLGQVLGAAKLTTGVDLETALGASLGSEWALYSAPDVGGSRAFGWVIANHLRDPAGAEKALTTLENVLCNMATAGLRHNQMQLRNYRVSRGGITVHYLGLAAVSPAWTIHNGNLYLAAYPQVALAAAESAAAGGSSILENPIIAAARKQPGGKPAGIAFVDLPATCADGYGTALLLSRYLLGLSDMLGAQSPALVVPPLHSLQPLMQPALSTSWTDDTGWYKRGAEPFPGSLLFAGDFTIMSGVMQPVLAAIVIPQFTNASDDARRSAVMSTTQSLRSQFELYRLQHADAYPDFEVYPKWEQLLQKSDEEGIPTPAGRFGPYLQNVPQNAFNGGSRIEVLSSPVKPGYKASRPGVGWIFVKSSGRLYPTDKNGVVILNW